MNEEELGLEGQEEEELRAAFADLEKAAAPEYDENGEIVEGAPAAAEMSAEPKEGDGLPSEEEADEIVRRYAASRGMKVVLPGEEEAVKAGAEADAKSKTAEEILAGLPDVPLDPAVIALIDEKYGDDPVKRDMMFVRYANQVATEQIAEQKLNARLAPMEQERQQAVWQAKAVATARDIAQKAEVPEAEQKVAELIMNLGPESEQMYQADPAYKMLVDGAIRDAIAQVRSSVADTEQRPLPTASRVGGGKPGGQPADYGLTGEDKKFADGVRKDVARGRLTKAEGDELLKSMFGAKK